MDIFEPAELQPIPDVFGNVGRRRIIFVGQQVLPAHTHNHAHAHVVIRGVVRCTMIDGERVLSVTDYPAGSMFEVPAKIGHQLQSVSEDGAEGWCIFAVRDEEGQPIEDRPITDAERRDNFWHERRGGG